MPHNYLVTFGRAGHLGRFAGELACARGDRVVVRSTRGVEVGTLLGPARCALPDPFIGELLRPASSDDLKLDADRESQAQRLAARAAVIGPVVVLDAEVMLDGRGAVLHALAGSVDAGPLLDQLATEFGLIVRLYDLAQEPDSPVPAPDHLEDFKCDRPDCGERDCSDGGCSTCSAGSKADVMEYFAGLREKMESRVPLA
jgi:hypothetical protein